MLARWKFSKRWGGSVPEPANIPAPERSPLAGKRVVVTRPMAQCGALCAALRAHGAEPLAFPLIRIVPAEDYNALDAALVKLRDGDWILLTSQNAVAAVAPRLVELGRKFAASGEVFRLAVVGPATEQAARESDLRVDYVARVHDGVSLAHELGEQLRGRRVVLPRSDLAGAELPQAITVNGGEAFPVIAYRTEPASECQELAALIAAGEIDAIVCFSPSAVRALVKIIDAGREVASRPRIAFAAIGEITARAYREAGVAEPLVAADTTDEALIHILESHFANVDARAENAAPHFAGVKPV
jgi:uroporphyrinogen III methyltransferase/synthase